MKNVMTKAWEIAKAGVKKFGGKVKEYFAEALRLAWKIVKGGNVNMQQLNGTEKQVAWAEDIRKNVLDIYNDIKEVVKTFSSYNAERHEETIDTKVIEALENETEATFFIDRFKIATSKYHNRNQKAKEIAETLREVYKVERGYCNLKTGKGFKSKAMDLIDKAAWEFEKREIHRKLEENN